jgi:hypothetical protein
MKMTSKWGGYAASFFSITYFGEGMAYAITHGDLPTWFAILTGSCFSLAALSGAVCLGAALLDYFQHRLQSNRPVGGGEVKESAA